MKKKSLKKKFKFLLFIIILGFIGFLIYNVKDIVDLGESNLVKLGYNNKEIELFNKYNIDENRVNKYYSELESVFNNNEFDSNNFDLYISELDNNVSVNDIFNKLNFKKEKYYLDKNINRYLSYYNKHNDLSFREIVKRVNSNVDYEFYTNIFEAKESDGYLILCNKFSKLESDSYFKLVSVTEYNRQGNAKLEEKTYEAFKNMARDAKESGVNIYNISGYRTLATQRNLYNNYVREDGVKAADTYSARSGHSEHNTGLALDLNTVDENAHFENSKEYKWLSENAYKYGFILRYPKGEEYITGYIFEPWHYRYVGVDAAKIIYEEGITFEEYYAFYVEK